MAYPDKTTPRSYGGSVPPAYITSDIPAYYTTGQTITISNAAGWYEIDDTGHETIDPLGTSGPFIVAVNMGQINEEKILCSDINIADSVITVWTDGTLNGRGYDGTIISTHNHQKTQTKTADIFHVFGAIEFLQFNEGIIAALQGGQGGQGAQGYQGAQGSAGTQGPQGVPGTGTQGPQGAAGTGSQGAQGAQGEPGTGGGAQGSQGYQGADGAQGPQGDLGPQGNDGAQGTQGNDGPQGTQGIVGASFPTYLAVINSPDGIATDGSFVNQTATFTVTDGPDAYVSPNRVTLIVSGGSCSYTGYISDVILGVGTTTFQVYIDGYTGTNSGDQINWYMSLSGIQGIQGAQGNDGAQGSQGNDGNQGPQGDLGPQGNDGSQGSQGSDGAQGAQGDFGPQGNDGAQGSTGPGFYYLSDYVSGHGYVPGAVVKGSNDNLYIATGSGELGDPATGAPGWEIYLPKGVQGPQGDSGTGGGSQGPQGNDGAQGAQGNDGAQGVQGDFGPQGNDGSQGAQGNDGNQGAQGNDGAQGAQGYQGQADKYATYSAAYTSIPTTFPFTDDISVNGGLAYSAGQGIVIAISGTDYAVAVVNTYDAVTGILNFTISASTDVHGNPFQGFSWGYAVNLDGAVGAQGTQGYQGDQGPQGNDGSQGSQGSQGNDGAQGSQGPQGTDALWNFSGPYNPGLIYTTGDVVTYECQTWYRLIYGASGRTPGDNIWWTLVAAEGNQGAQGATGDPGIYESADGVPPVNEDILWLDETVPGYAGPQGYQGAQGVQGARGYQGSVGAQGANGANGTNGSQGSQGLQGLQGSTGSQGSQGNAGTQGAQGASGTNGSQGAQGSQGNNGSGYAINATAFNVVKGTLVRYEAITAQINASTSMPQVSAYSGTVSVFWSYVQNVSGHFGNGTNTGASLSAGTWTNIGNSNAIGSGGDTVDVTIIDNTNSHVYRITYLQTVTPGNGTIVIEKLL